MIFSNHIAAAMIGAGIATVTLGTGMMTQQAPEKPKRPDCALAYSMPDDMAVKLIVPCEIVTNAAARSAKIEDRIAARQTMGLAQVPWRGKTHYDRLAQNAEPKNDYSMIIEKKKSEIEAKKKGKKK